MGYAMGKLGIRNILIDAVAGMGAEQASFITARDAVLAVSFTPYASETVALTNAARARGAKIVSITDSVFSPIASPADVLIEIVEANFEGFRSMTATHGAGDEPGGRSRRPAHDGSRLREAR